MHITFVVMVLKEAENAEKSGPPISNSADPWSTILLEILETTTNRASIT